MSDVIIRSLHFIGIMLLYSALFAEHLLIKKEMELGQFKKMAVLDAIFGLSALLMLGTGFMLWFHVGNMPEFYTSNWVFHIKLSLFFFVAFISLLPTIFFLRNRKSEQATILIPGRIIAIIRAELVILLCIPVVAASMAKGFGLG